MVEAFTKYSQFNLKMSKGFNQQFLTSFLQTKPSIRENCPKVLDEDVSEDKIAEEDISEGDISEEDISELDISEEDIL